MSTDAPALAVPADPGEPIDVAAFLAYLQHERRLSVNTVLTYGCALRQFAAWVESGGLASYLSPSVRELGHYLEFLNGQGLGLSSIALKLTAVKTFYRFLHLCDRIPDRVLALVRLIDGPTPWHCLPTVLNTEQATRFVEVDLPSDRYSLRNQALREILWATGCRSSEVCDLTLANLHLEERNAEVTGKGNKTRIVLLNRSAVDALRAYLERQRPRMVRHNPEAPWVFVSRSGKRLTREMLWRVVKCYARRAELPEKATTHTIRHTFASGLLAGGADLRVIGDLMGHANVVTTQQYTHIDAERLRQLHRQYHPHGSRPPETTLPKAA